jgi:hypothetical protein
MTKEEIDDAKNELYDFFVNDFSNTIAYRCLDASKTVSDSRWGIVTTEEYIETTLYAAVSESPSDKQKQAYGVTGDAELIVTLSTKELEDKVLVLEREKGWFMFGDNEYEILSIDARPDLFDTSIATIVSCKRRKPLTS